VTANLALAGLAVWSAAAPYVATAVGWDVPVSSAVEIVDHVFPGTLALGAALALQRLGRTEARDLGLRLGAVAVAVLSGVWVAASHAPLLLAASRGAVEWGAAILHATGGPLLLLAALWLLGAELRAP